MLDPATAGLIVLAVLAVLLAWFIIKGQTWSPKLQKGLLNRKK